MNPAIAKRDRRRQFLQARRTLSPEHWQSLSDRLCHQLQQLAVFKEASTILAYFSHHQEPDLSPLWQLPKQWGFPYCLGKSLRWHRWQPGETLIAGAYGILEPRPESETLSPQSVDLILVPAVACDRLGYRLGYGGGYYDRLLSLPEWHQIPTIGIVFEFAYVAALPKEEWDRPLTGICTETQGMIL